MKHLFILFALLISIPSLAQEEFLGTSSGLVADYSLVKVDDIANVHSFGFNAFSKNGFKAGIAASAMSEITYISFNVGGLWGNRKQKEESYFKGLIDVTYSNLESISVFGVSTGFVHCIHMTSRYPMSFSGIISAQTKKFDTIEDSSKGLLTVGFNYNQAFLADNSSYPYLGFGAAVDVGEFVDEFTPIILYTFKVGLNMSFGN